MIRLQVSGKVERSTIARKTKWFIYKISSVFASQSSLGNACDVWDSALTYEEKYAQSNTCSFQSSRILEKKAAIQTV